MIDTKWRFQTAPRHTHNSVRYEWCWRTTTSGGRVASAKSFTSLNACVADAKLHGFEGEIKVVAGFGISEMAADDAVREDAS
jgi:hypothetical protein